MLFWFSFFSILMFFLSKIMKINFFRSEITKWTLSGITSLHRAVFLSFSWSRCPGPCFRYLKTAPSPANPPKIRSRAFRSVRVPPLQTVQNHMFFMKMCFLSKNMFFIKKTHFLRFWRNSFRDSCTKMKGMSIFTHFQCPYLCRKPTIFSFSHFLFVSQISMNREQKNYIFRKLFRKKKHVCCQKVRLWLTFYIFHQKLILIKGFRGSNHHKKIRHVPKFFLTRSRQIWTKLSTLHD